MRHALKFPLYIADSSSGNVFVRSMHSTFSGKPATFIWVWENEEKALDYCLICGFDGPSQIDTEDELNEMLFEHDANGVIYVDIDGQENLVFRSAFRAIKEGHA